jgi:L-ribulokinase
LENKIEYLSISYFIHMKIVLGLDFGTDSVRALAVDVETGSEVGTAVAYYPRWKEKKFCNPALSQWRQHPLDYIESMESAIKTCIVNAMIDPTDVMGIAADTTGSTPVAVNAQGVPLALLPGMEEDPHAMFILWKDHTAIQEADEINKLAKEWPVDFTQFSGGIYSSEWFWAKILKTFRIAPNVRNLAYSWVEHADWIPFLLSGGRDISQMKRSRTAAGHKAMWHPSWGGLPAEAFLIALDPCLAGIRSRLYTETYCSDVPAGRLCAEWADRLGLPEGLTIAVGGFDAHMGAVGGQIKTGQLCKIMGTSTCDIMVSQQLDHLVLGICGQVDGSVIPGLTGLEAGQSAFGDLYAWLVEVLMSGLKTGLAQSNLTQSEKEKLLDGLANHMMEGLSLEAEKIPIGAGGILALDWMNGRRTPDANQMLTGMITGLKLGTSAAQLFRAIVEASCFGARMILDRFHREGISVDGVIGLGGIAKKSPFIMQMMADILHKPVQIVKSEQACALGAAMFAAVAAGIFDSVSEAMAHMGSGYEKTYQPAQENVALYDSIYEQYKIFAMEMEPFQMKLKI